MTINEMENRLKGALWAFFAGDALSSPTHWFYGGLSEIVKEYGHPIQDYTQPKEQFAGTYLNQCNPNGGGLRDPDDQSKISIVGDVINHGKLKYWAQDQSYHYHATLQKGENTLEASLARVLMKSIVATNGKFDPEHFRNQYMEFMQTEGSHNDTFASSCHRIFFSNLIAHKLSPEDCRDSDVYHIDGLVLPTIVALSALKDSNVAELSASCVGTTRNSKALEDTAGLWSELLVAAFGDDFSAALATFSDKTIQRPPNPSVDETSTMSPCGMDASLPGLIDVVAKYSASNCDGTAVWDALLGIANVGGENVHRAAVLGAVLGARAGYKALPSKLVDGLYDKDGLERDIEAFCRAVLPKDA